MATSYFVTGANEFGSIDLSTGQVKMIDVTTNTYTDVAIAPDGSIYANTFGGLYKLDVANDAVQEELVMSLPGSFNAMEFARDGSLYAVSGTSVYELDPDGEDATLVGNVSSSSAGDLHIVGNDLVLSTLGRDLVSFDLVSKIERVAFDGTPNDLFGLASTGTELFGLFDQSMVTFDIASQTFHEIELSGDQVLGSFFGATSPDQFEDFSGGPVDNVTRETGTAGLDEITRDYRSLDIAFVDIGQNASVVQFGDVERIELSSVERINLINGTLALDIAGNAGQAYRVYQAAFARTPDNDGLKFWIDEMDGGTTLRQVGDGFVFSDEFAQVYGTNVSSTDLVSRLYQNVLGRDGEAAGIDYWVGELDSGRQDKTSVLVGFSESKENIDRVAPTIDDGIFYS